MRLIALADISVPKRPPRRFLGAIEALADSMQTYGLQQPISVRVEGSGYILTSGLRRLTAAKLLGWTSIMAFVRPVSADDAYILDLIENLQREDLSPEEEADALLELTRTRGWTLQQVADAVKRSVSYVSKRARIFEDPELRRAVVERGLAVSTAEELLGAKAAERAGLIERAVKERWDQERARAVLHPAATEAPASPPATRQPRRRSGRPPGFTRAIREFHEQIIVVRAEDLTDADRSALRSLFRDLILLARASTVAVPRLFPPLPREDRPRRGR
jgi:ParB/RepB/Spo0J family partition protein